MARLAVSLLSLLLFAGVARPPPAQVGATSSGKAGVETSRVGSSSNGPIGSAVAAGLPTGAHGRPMAQRQRAQGRLYKKKN